MLWYAQLPCSLKYVHLCVENLKIVTNDELIFKKAQALNQQFDTAFSEGIRSTLIKS